MCQQKKKKNLYQVQAEVSSENTKIFAINEDFTEKQNYVCFES
jgi:hypothetical protein